MYIISTIKLALTFLPLLVYAGQDETNMKAAVDSGNQPAEPTNIVRDFVGDYVHPPTRVSWDSTNFSFVGEDGHKSAFDKRHLNRRSGHTTLNDYLATPTPGVTICSRPNFKGKCRWSPVEPNPVICQRMPTGTYQKMCSVLIDHDLQCAFHSDKDCKGGHTYGRFIWPDLREIRSNWFGIGGDVMAYRCRKCDGCTEGDNSIWDGQNPWVHTGTPWGQSKRSLDNTTIKNENEPSNDGELLWKDDVAVEDIVADEDGSEDDDVDFSPEDSE